MSPMSPKEIKEQIARAFPGTEVRVRKSRLGDQVVYRASSPSGHIEVEVAVGGRRDYVQGTVDLQGDRITLNIPSTDLIALRETLLSFWGDLGIALGMLDDVLGRQANRPPQLTREDPHGNLVGVSPLAPLAQDVGGVVAGHDRHLPPPDRDP